MMEDTTTAYRAAKAIRAGQKLWCMWAEQDPFVPRSGDINKKKTGFVLSQPSDMRRMAADLFRLADAIEELENMWDDDQ